MEMIAYPLTKMLEFLCNIFNSYPIAIFVFTVVVNVVLIPLNIKQQKSMAKQARLRPRLEALKEKCGDDKMKYQNAMTELYQKENVSMTGGCLPMVIRMVIILLVYSSVRQITGYDASAHATVDPMVDIKLFQFLGIDLTQIPSFSTDIVNKFQLNWLIPILCFLTQMCSMLVSNKQNRANNPQMDQSAKTMTSMMFIMPIFSLWITFSVQSAVGLYWICSSIVNTLIMLFVNHHFSADRMIAKDTAIMGKARREKEQQIKSKAE